MKPTKMEQRLAIMQKIADLTKNQGMSIATACKEVGIRANRYYYWRTTGSTNAKKKSNVKVITYDGAVVTKRRAAKIKDVDGELFFVMGSPDQVARFYKSLKE